MISALAVAIYYSIAGILEQSVQPQLGPQWPPLAKHSQYSLRHLERAQEHLPVATLLACFSLLCYYDKTFLVFWLSLDLAFF